MKWIKLREVIKDVRLLKESNGDFKEIKIAFLRNYTVEKIIPYLELFFLKEGFLPKFYFSGYDNIFQDILNDNSDYYQFDPDLTILSTTISDASERLTHNFVQTLQDDLDSELKRVVSQTENIISILSKKKVGAILVHNYETPKFPALGILDYQSKDYQVNSFRKLNLKLTDICEKYNGVHIIDIDFLQRLLGTEEVNDRRYWHIEKKSLQSKIFAINCSQLS